MYNRRLMRKNKKKYGHNYNNSSSAFSAYYRVGHFTFRLWRVEQERKRWERGTVRMTVWGCLSVLNHVRPWCRRSPIVNLKFIRRRHRTNRAWLFILLAPVMYTFGQLVLEPTGRVKTTAAARWPYDLFASVTIHYRSQSSAKLLRTLPVPRSIHFRRHIHPLTTPSIHVKRKITVIISSRRISSRIFRWIFSENLKNVW